MSRRRDSWEPLVSPFEIALSPFLLLVNLSTQSICFGRRVVGGAFALWLGQRLGAHRSAQIRSGTYLLILITARGHLKQVFSHINRGGVNRWSRTCVGLLEPNSGRMPQQATDRRALRNVGKAERLRRLLFQINGIYLPGKPTFLTSSLKRGSSRRLYHLASTFNICI